MAWPNINVTPGSGANIFTLPGPRLWADPLAVSSFASSSTASITRKANTTTYTAFTGWNATAATVFTFLNVAAYSGQQIAVTGIDIYSSANPALLLQGALWLFNVTPGTVIADNATFTIASADYANLTAGSFGTGIPFTLGNNQASGAANSGVSLTPSPALTGVMNGSTSLFGMVEVINAYVPVSGEVLTVTIHSIGLS